ncbi:MAG TPA: DUF402 domain-containing protein, partial [Acidimicrobiia bacterium]|nr:DUF402 domain-containing protein [Acidimicrobiia bacterium]
GPTGRLLLPGGWDGAHERDEWRGPSTVRVHPVGASFVVYRNWNPGSREYEGWYVNLESPWARTPIGFDGVDHVLDIRVADDLSSWSWKDEDELAWSLEMGMMTAAEADAARAEGERVISLIESRAWPFNADWSAWEPDPEWPVPEVPTGWDDPC